MKTGLVTGTVTSAQRKVKSMGTMFWYTVISGDNAIYAEDISTDVHVGQQITVRVTATDNPGEYSYQVVALTPPATQ